MTIKMPVRVAPPVPSRISSPGLSPRTTVRIAAVGGAVFFGLIIAFASLLTNTPSVTDTRAEIFGYFAQHHDRIQLAAALYGLAMPAALLSLSGLYRVLRAAEAGTTRLATAALGGGILAAASTVVGALVMGTTATRYADLGPTGTRVFWTMSMLSLGATLLGLLLVIGTTATVCLRTDTFPRWFIVMSVVLAVASGVGAFTIGYAAVGIQVVAGVAILADSVWMLLMSIYLWQRPSIALP